MLLESRVFDRCVQDWRSIAMMLLVVAPEADVLALDSTEDAASPRYLQLEVGLGHENLSNGLPDWSSAAVRLDYHFDAKQLIYGSFRDVRRFDKADKEWSLGSVFPIGDDWVVGIDASIAPGADVLPQAAASLHLQRILDGGWIVGLRHRHSSYESTYGDVDSLSVERYWKAFRFAYRISAGKAEDAERAVTHEVRSDYYYHEPSSVGLSLVSGQESESIGIGRLITTDVFAASLQGLHWFTSNWAVRWRVGYHRQGKLYSRAGVDVSLSRRF